MAYESYYETVLDNKSHIEAEIDFYWQYILKYFENNGEDDDFGAGGQRRSSHPGMISS